MSILSNCVVFNQVSFQVKNQTILGNIDLKIKTGETCAIIGPSGSGKSTLLKLINRLLIESSGTIEIFGNSTASYNVNNLRKMISFVLQGSGLFPHLNVFENITIQGKISNHSKARRKNRATELLDLAGLPRYFLEKHTFELSGGETQRVGLCRALYLDPELMLLDEAFSALDTISKNELYTYFENIQKVKPRTIVIVSHDFREVQRLAQTVFIMNRGEIIQHGSVTEIMSNPKSHFVKEFIKL